MKVREAIELYKPIAAAQVSHSWKTWCRQFESRWGSREVATIDAGEINVYIAEKRKEGKAEATIRSQLITLRALFKVARKAGDAAHWPTEDLARVKPNPGRLRFYEGDEMQRLKQTMNAYDFEIVELAAATGLRRAELWNLEKKDVNLRTRFIRVLGKGKKVRQVPIGKTAFKLLTKILARPGSKYVVMPVGHERYTQRKTSIAVFMRDVWRPCLRQAGIHNFVWHSNRHDFASKMACAGKSLQVIKECLGHSSINQTMIYAHLNNAALHDAVSCV